MNTYRHVPLARAPQLFAEAWRLTQWRFDFVALFLLNHGLTLALGTVVKSRAGQLAAELAGIALIPGLWLLCHDYLERKQMRPRLNFALFLDPALALRLAGWLVAMVAVQLGFELLEGKRWIPYQRVWLTLLQIFLLQLLSGLALPLQLFRRLDFPAALRGAFIMLRSWPAIALVMLGQLVGLLSAALPAMLLLILFYPAFFEAGAKGIDWASNLPLVFGVLLLLPLPLLVVAGPTVLTGYLLFRELAPPDKQIE